MLTKLPTIEVSRADSLGSARIEALKELLKRSAMYRHACVEAWA
jgi:hypothetical protein